MDLLVRRNWHCTAAECAAFALLVSGCGPKSATETVPDAPVISSFELLPPVARNVSVWAVEGNPGGNVIVVAEFERGAIKGQFHAVMLSTGKVVLRDDGRGGDAHAGDASFSVALHEDSSALMADLRTAQARARELRAKPRPRFVGRELRRPDTSEIPLVNAERFGKGVPVQISSELLCNLVVDVDPARSLMITDISVIEDPALSNVTPCSPGASASKPWTFGKLMTDMANQPTTGVNPEDFVKNWLNTWLTTTSVNSDQIPERDNLFNVVIRPWVIRSGSPSGSFDINTWMSRPLNLDIAPFKLTAIVNRLDLRGNSGYGLTKAGEGRFVFEVLNPSTCVPLNPAFNVIFEYGIPINNCRDLKEYARKWHELKSLTFPSPAYNSALRELTDVFAKAGAAPSKPNGNSINQVRTNEIVLDFSAWELREFNIDPGTHQLALTTVKQEPANRLNARGGSPGPAIDIAQLAAWVNANEAAVIQDKHVVPSTFSASTTPFLGGKAHTDGSMFWDAAPMAVTNGDARHHFSLNTCSGCHGAEANPSVAGNPLQFVHIGRADFGTQAQLSGFLTGITIQDPAGRPGPPATRVFNDLERRRQSLEKLICKPCGKPLFELLEALTFEPVHMSH